MLPNAGGQPRGPQGRVGCTALFGPRSFRRSKDVACGVEYPARSADRTWRARSRDSEETPFTGDAFEGMGSVLAKVETGACDEILYRARHQDLAWPRLGHDARARMDGHAGELVIHALALAGVNTGADLDTEAPHGISDALGATYGAGRPVEC